MTFCEMNVKYVAKGVQKYNFQWWAKNHENSIQQCDNNFIHFYTQKRNKISIVLFIMTCFTLKNRIFFIEYQSDNL